ncbi:lipoyl synthase [SCandidatus Aminicenantes bacterium Aminicenantia_JdfR_composite]|nr:lipoyl synthase [SCandidatus Aminicenantes bacterium Aminicenantia_JdfR_composite]MCP2597957.1 lipoyl synthase [Candidatus Aminicenantes bacterium AC-335-L06]
MRQKRTKPLWFKTEIPSSPNFFLLKKILKNLQLHTVCEEAKCPNIGNCWAKKTATFMILGNTCTRNCRFCAVRKGIPEPPNNDEPVLISEAVKLLGIKYAVITSVTRDDLSDGGASIFARTVNIIRKVNPDVKIEVLIPDFNGNENALNEVFEVKPDILNHNLETVQELYPFINRPSLFYTRSLKILEKARKHKLITKSGLMIGLGETKEQIIKSLKDLRNVGCDIITIGQYLQPTKAHVPVKKYYTEKEFEELKLIGKQLGFKWVEAGPLVRSSFHATQIYEKINLRRI